MDAQVSIALATLAIGGIVWLVRLEGKINANIERVDDLRDDVTYIRNRIDDALKGNGGGGWFRGNRNSTGE